MKRGTAALIAALLLAALLSSWLAYRENRAPRPAAAPGDAPAVDYFVSGFTTTEMDAAGHPALRVSAERMQHYSDGTSAMLQPRLTLFRAEGEWRIRAEQGYTRSATPWIYLEEQVRLQRPEAEGRGVLTVATELLRVDPERDYAETERPVHITRPGSRVDAVGLQAYGAEERIVLSSQVRGIHEPAID